MSPCSFILIPVTMSCFLEWFFKFSCGILTDKSLSDCLVGSIKYGEVFSHMSSSKGSPPASWRTSPPAPAASTVPISSMLGKSDNKSNYWIDMFYRYLPRVKGPTACLWVTTLLPSYRGSLFSSCYHQKPSTELHQKPRHQLKSTKAVDDSA